MELELVRVVAAHPQWARPPTRVPARAGPGPWVGCRTRRRGKECGCGDETRRSPPCDRAPGGGQESLGVGGVDGWLGRRLDQTELDGVVVAGEGEDVRHRRDRLRGELDRASEARRQVPGMRGGVDDREVHDDGAGQDTERRGVLRGHHPVAVPQLHGLRGHLGGDRRPDRPRRAPPPSTRRGASGPRRRRCPPRTTGSSGHGSRDGGPSTAGSSVELHLLLGEPADHPVQEVLGVRQQGQVIHGSPLGRLTSQPDTVCAEAGAEPDQRANGSYTPDLVVGATLRR